MAWNDPKDDVRRGAGAPRRDAPRGAGWRGLLQRMRRQGSALAGLAAALLLLLVASSCFYQVEDSERGVVQRFGRVQRVDAPGGHWHWPWPVETATSVNVARAISLPLQADVMSADAGLVDVVANVQYLTADPVKSLFSVRDLGLVVREAAYASLREVLARSDMAALLGTNGRNERAEQIRAGVQQRLDRFDSGVQVRAVSLTEIRVPAAVAEAQQAVEQARSEAAGLAGEARHYADDILPRARSEAAQQQLAAAAYKRARVAGAETEAARVAPLVAAYAQAPEITRSRLYIETLEDIYAHGRRVYVDLKGGNGNVLYLPLDKLLPAGQVPAAAQTQAGAGAAAAGPAGGAAQAAAATGDAATSGARPGVSVESVPDSPAAAGADGAAERGADTRGNTRDRRRGER